MALGDGSAWDETTPTDATIAVQIDDYNRDLRVGVRSRMAFEHEWPSSQSVTGAGGRHKFVTFQVQSTQPTLAGTQIGAIYMKTVGTRYEAFIARASTGAEEIQLTTTGGVNATAAAGQVIKVVSAISTTYANIGTTALPIDNSIPQITEGNEVTAINTSITPASATNELVIFVQVPFSISGAQANAGFALFVGTTANALAVGINLVNDTPCLSNVLIHKMAAGTTGAMAFSVRVGNAGGGAVHVNGIANGGTRLFGGVLAALMCIQEVKV